MTTATEPRLEWNPETENYEAPYDSSHTLVVSGIDWAQEHLDRAKALFREKHPELERSEIDDAFANGGKESDDCLDAATEELLDPFPWTTFAVEVDEHGERTDGHNFEYSAWIKPND